MTLAMQYQAAVLAGDISDSPAQREVVVALDAITLESSRTRWYWPWRRVAALGLYLYGPVGTGKTFLMDLFYNHYPSHKKARFHFHHFMQMIDGELRRLQGASDPVRVITRQLAKTARVLCLDELLVHDVAHAMILADLLQGLLRDGVILIVTANTRPDDLYQDGVHRERFLPAIQLIKQACRVVELDCHRDYRMGRLQRLDTYFFPLTPESERAMRQAFSQIAPGEIIEGELTIQHRQVPYVGCVLRAVWFEFDVLCNLPRSQLDYLELATRFDTVFVSHIPAIGPDDTVRALLLIRFVDVMYDQGVRLVISAAVPTTELYAQGSMLNEFKRTLSRLEEMQSGDYLRRHVHDRELEKH